MKDAAAEDGRWHEVLRAPYLLPLITLALGVALFAFNIFFVITALPTAVGDLHGLATITWASSLYLIFAIVTGAAAGLAKEHFGARTVFLAGSAVFIAGTLLCGFAPDMTVLLAGRIMQGAGAGFIEGLSYAMIPVLFPPRLVPKVFGVEATMWVLAAFGGPAVAGFLTTQFGWRSAFLSSLPLALIFITLVLRIVPRETKSNGTMRFPGVRLGLIAAGLLLVTLSSVTRPLTAALLNCCAAVLIAIGVLLDRKNSNRLFPRSAFSLAVPFGLGFWVVVLMAIPESAVPAFLPYTMQHVWGYSPGEAGAIHSLLAIGWSFSQIAVATFASPRVRRELIWVGTALLATGLILSSAGVSTGYFPVIILAQAMIGIAFGINWGSLSQLLMDAASEEERVIASSLLPTAQTGGFALGASLAGLTGNLLGFAQAGSAQEIQATVALVFLIAGIAAIPIVPIAFKVVRAVKV